MDEPYLKGQCGMALYWSFGLTLLGLGSALEGVFCVPTNVGTLSNMYIYIYIYIYFKSIVEYSSVIERWKTTHSFSRINNWKVQEKRKWMMPLISG